MHYKSIIFFYSFMEKREEEVILSKEETLAKTTQPSLKLLDDNQVDVDIDPNVKSNDVKIQLCSCSIVLYCFSPR